MGPNLRMSAHLSVFPAHTRPRTPSRLPHEPLMVGPSSQRPAAEISPTSWIADHWGPRVIPSVAAATTRAHSVGFLPLLPELLSHVSDFVGPGQ